VLTDVTVEGDGVATDVGGGAGTGERTKIVVAAMITTTAAMQTAITATMAGHEGRSLVRPVGGS